MLIERDDTTYTLLLESAVHHACLALGRSVKLP